MKLSSFVVAGCATIGLTSVAAAQVWLYNNGVSAAFRTHGPPPVNPCSATIGQLDFTNSCQTVFMTQAFP